MRLICDTQQRIEVQIYPSPECGSCLGFEFESFRALNTDSPTQKLLVLCQHFYPEMISTGKIITELAVGLKRKGWEIDVVCAQPTTRFEGAEMQVAREIEYEGIGIFRLRTFGNHRGNVFDRLMFALSYVAGAGAWALSRSGNYVGLVFTTNPPFLGLIGWVLKAVRRKPFALIVHDVYPEMVIRLGIV